MASTFRKGQRVRIKSTGREGVVASTYTVAGDQIVEIDTPEGTSIEAWAAALERVRKGDG